MTVSSQSSDCSYSNVTKNSIASLRDSWFHTFMTGRGDSSPGKSFWCLSPGSNFRWFSLEAIPHVLPEKAMAPHSGTPAWRIPWMEEPRRLQSMGSLRVGHDWATSLSLFTFLHWRRKWQPTPVFLPGEFQGRGSLVGCRLQGRTELDTTEVTSSSSSLMFSNNFAST